MELIELHSKLTFLCGKRVLLAITAIALKLSHYRVNWSGNESAKSRKQALTLKLSGIKTPIDCFMPLCVNLY